MDYSDTMLDQAETVNARVSDLEEKYGDLIKRSDKLLSSQGNAAFDDLNRSKGFIPVDPNTLNSLPYSGRECLEFLSTIAKLTSWRF